MNGWHFCLRIGRWMLNRGGLWHWVEIRNQKYRWHDWRRVL